MMYCHFWGGEKMKRIAIAVMVLGLLVGCEKKSDDGQQMAQEPGAAGQQPADENKECRSS